MNQDEETMWQKAKALMVLGAFMVFVLWILTEMVTQ